MKGATPLKPSNSLWPSGASTSIVRRSPERRGMTARAEAEGSGERRPWDINRFTKTVMFFNEMPSPSDVLTGILEQPLKLIRSFIGPQDVEAQKTSVLRVIAPSVLAGPEVALSTTKASVEGIILVTGATGGVGKRVVAELLKQGAAVRALVRDAGQAEKMLASLPRGKGSSLDVVAADIAQKQTLLPEYFKGVRAAVLCTAAITAPKDGGKKPNYSQSIKFYDPQIVGDTPETVEYIGIKNIVDSSKERLGSEMSSFLFDPSTGKLANTWGPLDDVVMGGCSESNLEVQGGAGEDGGYAGVFCGNVTSANNGGFASVRCKNFNPAKDFGAYEGIEIRVKGDGQRYKLVLRQDAYWDSISFIRSFDTTDGEWQSIRLPFSDFRPVFRARTVKDGSELNSSSITSVQIMLSKFEYDGNLNPNFRLGKFSLPVAYIKSYYTEPVTPRLILCSAAGATSADESRVWRLKGEDVVRSSGVPYSILQPLTLTEEPRGAPLVLEQGDVTEGKISRSDVAELLVEMLSQPSALDTTFRAKSAVPVEENFEPKSGSENEPRDWKALFEGASPAKSVAG